MVFGKLKASATMAEAQQELDGIAVRLGERYPSTNAGSGVSVQPLKEQIVGNSRTPLLIVLASVGTVLLIACANVGNLQLARAAAHRRELSVRAALGAGRQRLVRQLLTESLVLSVVGGLAGLGIAYAGVRVTAHHALVVGQIALCVVLLVCAGLLTRSLIALAPVQPGFDATNVLTLQFRLPPARYDGEQKIADMFDRTIREIRIVPGVQSAALVRATPLNDNGERIPYEVDGSTITEVEKLPSAHRNIVSPGFFETLRIPRMSNRDFSEDDRATTLPVAIVNEQTGAGKIAPGESAIGRRVRLRDGDEPVWVTIVGVVGNARHFQVNEAQLDQVYLPYQQKALIFTEVVVRSSGDLMLLSNAVRSAIWRVDRDQPVWGVRPVVQSIERQLGSRQFTMRLLASFTGLAVLLAVIGVYGVMSYAAARRTQEMGVRMALGAGTTQVVGLVLRQGMRSIALALVIGVAAALAATRVLETQLYGVEPTDPLTFIAVPLTLAVVALAACYLPARRASRVDPIAALRTD